MKKLTRSLLFIFNLISFFGVFSLSTVWARDTLKVVVSILPQKYFVEKIGGDLVEVSVMVRPGFSPATYEPKPRQIVELNTAKIYFAIGVPFERVWLKKFAGVNPEMTIVHTDEGIEKIPMKSHRHRDEKMLHHEPKIEHHYGVKDPHIWLSPLLVKLQSRTIFESLAKADYSNKQIYQANCRVFFKELGDLDLRIRKVFSGVREGAQFMVYHPSWGYFAKSYGLEQIPIETEGKEPTSRELQELVNEARERRIKAIFVQPQFSTKRAQTIAKAIGCELIFADPLAMNWSENLLKVAEDLRTAME